jgi:hypothetical protein
MAYARTLRRSLLLLLVGSPAAEAGVFSPNSFDECILERMPGTANESAARAIRQQCFDEFPDFDPEKEPKKRGSFFASMTAQECFAYYAKTTPDETAAAQIRRSCFRMYFAKDEQETP